MKKLLILAVLVSVSFCQNNKPKFNFDKLKDPEPKWPIFSSPFTSTSFNDSVLDSIKTIQINDEGFRIQVFATRERANAERLVNELSVLYNEKIYIIFEAPNYKVRIGNYIDREDAEEVRSFLTNKGFPSAWIVRTKIDISDELN